MDEQIKERVAQSIDSILGYVESAAEFTAQQAPLVANEIISWSIFRGLFLSASLALMTGVMVFALHKIWTRLLPRLISEESYDPYFAPIMLSFFIVPSSFISGCASAINFMNAMKAYFAPRLFIIEFLRDLV